MDKTYVTQEMFDMLQERDCVDLMEGKWYYLGMEVVIVEG